MNNPNQTQGDQKPGQQQQGGGQQKPGQQQQESGKPGQQQGGQPGQQKPAQNSWYGSTKSPATAPPWLGFAQVTASRRVPLPNTYERELLSDTVRSLEQPTATLSRPLQDFMSYRPQGQTRSAVGLLIATILSLLMLAVVMAYQFTGDFTGLFKSGTSQTIRMRD
jgi:hypothetical protein